MNEFVLASLAFNKVDLGPSIISDPSSLPPIIELIFDTDPKVVCLVEQSAKRFDNLVSAHELHVLHYEGFGKDFTKKHTFSPDATVQLIKQLAFHKFMGRPGVTYESAQTRRFQMGRTEVIRSASNESKAWVEAMLDPTIKVGYLCIIDWISALIFQYQGSGVPPFTIHAGRRSTYPIRYMGCRRARSGQTPVWVEETVERRRASTRDIQRPSVRQVQSLGIKHLAAEQPVL